jgi:hypothetical protein
MKIKFSMLGLVLFTLVAQAQPDAKKYGDQITGDKLKEYLNILASDALEGRETGKRGQKMAAAFIAAHFQEIGLAAPVNGSYFQPVDLYTMALGDAYIKTGNTRLENYKDIAYYGSADMAAEETLPLVFVGNGKEDDLASADVKDKAVVLLAEGRLFGNKAVAALREKGAKMILACNTTTQDEFNTLADQIRMFNAGGRLSLEKPKSDAQNNGLFVLSPSATEKLMGTTLDKLKKAAAEDPKKGALKKIKTSPVQIRVTQKVSTVRSENVLGYLEGTDKKDELIIVTAHYDHIGKRASGNGDLINNGADDDGSGTTAVMYLAKMFAQAKADGKGPRRSMLFMTVTGEEKGLLGSEYYAENPVYPLANTVVDLNIDMIGRRDPQHKDSAPYVYVIGADKLSAELNKLSEEVNNNSTRLIFDYTYNDESHPDRLYYRSDHWNFAKKNVPIIFYFDGIHEDYHKPSDEVNKIEFDLMALRTQCVFYTAWEIANREARITADPDKIKK